MANRFFGANKGQQKTDIVQSSSTQSKSIELNVDLAAGMDKNEVLIKLKELEEYIIENIWPPA